MFYLLNNTTHKLVRDEDGNICEFRSDELAKLALKQVNEIKKLNPEHAKDEISILVL